MTVTITRRTTTLYTDEKADMVLYVDGLPGDINAFWKGLRTEEKWEIVIGVDGRIVLKPETPKKRRRT